MQKIRPTQSIKVQKFLYQNTGFRASITLEILFLFCQHKNWESKITLISKTMQ